MTQTPRLVATPPSLPPAPAAAPAATQTATLAATPAVTPAAASTASGATTTSAQQKIQNFNANPTLPPIKPRGAKSPEELKPEDLGPEPPPGGSQQPFSDAVKATNGFFKNISVTTGLGIAFFVLVALIWFLIPTASGFTRAQLLWFTLLGETKLTTDNSPDQNNPGQTPAPFPQDTNITGTTNAVPALTVPSSGPGGYEQNNPPSMLSGIDLSALDYGF